MNLEPIVELSTIVFQSPLVTIPAGALSTGVGYAIKSISNRRAIRRQICWQALEIQRDLWTLAFEQRLNSIPADKRPSWLAQYVEKQFAGRVEALRSVGQSLSPGIDALLAEYSNRITTFVGRWFSGTNVVGSYVAEYDRTKEMLPRLLKRLGHFKELEAILVESGIAGADVNKTMKVDGEWRRNVLGYKP